MSDLYALKIFHLYRREDETGISGTGIVADGTVFLDGSVTMRWRGETASTGIYKSIDDVRTIHGHGGKTEVVIHSPIWCGYCTPETVEA